MNISALKESADIAQQAMGETLPFCAIALGTGWGDIVSAFDARCEIAYGDIPVLGQSLIAGHGGRMVLAACPAGDVLFFQGRRHWYEGLGWEPIAFPIYVCVCLNIPVLVLTNAAGGIRESLKPGDMMVIDDHINAMGVNPLIGPHDPVWGPRFPDQTEVYDSALRKLVDRAAGKLGENLPHGVYLAASGPTYETPAEVEAFRRMGASAVGMSTVPEAIMANAAGIRVVGISCIANRAADRKRLGISHEEVLVQMARMQPRMKALFLNLLSETAFQVACDESR